MAGKVAAVGCVGLGSPFLGCHMSFCLSRFFGCVVSHACVCCHVVIFVSCVGVDFCVDVW